MKMHKRHALVAGTALALALALSGCSTITNFLNGGTADADRDEATGQVTEGANIGIFALKLGDCMMEAPSGLLEDIDVVPCAELHDQEVYHEITMDDGDFSEDAINTASEECIGDAYTSFVGVAYEASTLTVTTIAPTKDTWEQLNDRVIQCIIFDEAGQIEGSLKGAAR